MASAHAEFQAGGEGEHDQGGVEEVLPAGDGGEVVEGVGAVGLVDEVVGGGRGGVVEGGFGGVVGHGYGGEATGGGAARREYTPVVIIAWGRVAWRWMAK